MTTETKNEISTIEQYIQMLIEMYSQNSNHWESIAKCYEFFLENGAKLTEIDREASIKEGLGKEAKQCYGNCQGIALYRKDLTYYDGYCMSVIPLEHAWLVNEDGEIVDPTLGIPFRGKDMLPEKADYIGLPIPRAYIQKIIFGESIWRPLWLTMVHEELFPGKELPKFF